MNIFYTPKNGRAQCYGSLHLNFHEYLWSHEAGKASIERAILHKLLKYNKYIIHVLVLRLNIITGRQKAVGYMIWKL